MKFILGLMTIVFSSLASANITLDNEYLLNKFMQSTGQKTQLGTLVQQTKNLLVARYSFAVQGGSSAADIKLLTNLNDKTSYAKLPKNAIITNAWVNILTAPTGSPNPTIALKTMTNADLLAATAVQSANWSSTGYMQAVPTGATTTYVKLTQASNIKAVMGTTGVITGGKFDVFIEWVLGN